MNKHQVIFVCYLFLFSQFYCVKLKTKFKPIIKENQSDNNIENLQGYSITLKKTTKNKIQTISFISELQDSLDNFHSCKKIVKIIVI